MPAASAYSPAGDGSFRRPLPGAREPLVPMPSTAASPFFRPVSAEQGVLDHLARLAALKRCGGD